MAAVIMRAGGHFADLKLLQVVRWQDSGLDLGQLPASPCNLGEKVQRPPLIPIARCYSPVSRRWRSCHEYRVPQNSCSGSSHRFTQGLSARPTCYLTSKSINLRFSTQTHTQNRYVFPNRPLYRWCHPAWSSRCRRLEGLLPQDAGRG